EGIEDRGHVEVDLREVWPDVAGRHDDVLRKRTIALDADAHRVGAQRAAARHAVAALAADDVALGAYQLANVDGLDALAQRGNLTDELVTDDQPLLDGGLRPFVPRVDVQVGTADARAEDADQHLARAGLRLRDI